MPRTKPPTPVSYTYPELWQPIDEQGDPDFPEKCPVCQAKIAVPSLAKIGHRKGPDYECGGCYTFKPQCQNHTNKWWGSCPTARDLRRININNIPYDDQDQYQWKPEGPMFKEREKNWPCGAEQRIDCTWAQLMECKKTGTKGIRRGV